MDNKIPLPTDNIYKFYSMFGLLLVIFGFGSIIYLNKTTNDLVFESMVELENLNSIKQRSALESTQEKVILRKIELANMDKKSFIYLLNALIVIGTFMMIYGFKQWHYKVQPIQDEISKLTLEKLRHEVKTMKDQSSEDI